jgi:hypothetical protein
MGMNKKVTALIGFGIAVLVIVAIIMNPKKAQAPKVSLITPTPNVESAVPLPQKTDIIRSFFNLIDEDRAADAVLMLSQKNIAEDSLKQVWAVQFNAIDKISVVKIEEAGENTYKVTLNVLMKPGSENVNPMPFYGWGNGEFVRWVSIDKENNIWKITGIATGP